MVEVIFSKIELLLFEFGAIFPLFIIGGSESFPPFPKSAEVDFIFFNYLLNHLIRSQFMMNFLDADFPSSDIPTLSAEFFHPGKCELSQVSMFNSRAKRKNKQINCYFLLYLF